MFDSLLILGRQPAIGLAELESLFSASLLQTTTFPGAVFLDLDPTQIPFERLGGSVRTCQVLDSIPTTNWPEIEKYLKERFANHSATDHKMNLGISVYGLNVSPPKLNTTLLKLKKILKFTGQSIRILQNSALELGSAEVLYNKLTSGSNQELILVKDGSSTILAQTIAIQNIDNYSARDQTRPARDTRVGMLPPKLAQIIINLAVGKIDTSTVNSQESTAQGDTPTLLDPFCGTGVVLQEALLMGYPVIGTDLEPRMVEYSKTNLDWLSRQANSLQFTVYSLEKGDATSLKWPKPFDCVASETYLGRPLAILPSREDLRKIVNDCNTIHRKFLKNLASQTSPGFRLCLAIPAWSTPEGFWHLSTLDSLRDLGYTRVSFDLVDDQDLVYHRPGQIVGRELVVLSRI